MSDEILSFLLTVVGSVVDSDPVVDKFEKRCDFFMFLIKLYKTVFAISLRH